MQRKDWWVPVGIFSLAAPVFLIISLITSPQNPVQNPIFQPQYGAVQEITNCRTDLTAQAANLTTTNLCTLPSFFASYRISCYVVLTQAATTSSTLPACNIVYTDNDTGNVNTVPVTNTSAANVVGTPGGEATTSNEIVTAKAGTALQVASTGYASSGATPMQYAIHVRTELVY